MVLILLIRMIIIIIIFSLKWRKYLHDNDATRSAKGPQMSKHDECTVAHTCRTLPVIPICCNNASQKVAKGTGLKKNERMDLLSDEFLAKWTTYLTKSTQSVEAKRRHFRNVLSQTEFLVEMDTEISDHCRWLNDTGAVCSCWRERLPNQASSVSFSLSWSRRGGHQLLMLVVQSSSRPCTSSTLSSGVLAYACLSSANILCLML